MATKQERIRKLESQVKKLESEKMDQAQSASFSIERKEADTRHEVAKRYVKFYFVLLLVVIIGIPIYNYISYKSFMNGTLLIDLKDTILTYSAVVGPTLGLVVAYYFKTKNN